MGGGDISDDDTDSSTGAGEEVRVNIRCTNGSEFFVQVNLNSPLNEFKSVVAHKCEIPAQQQRLIYKGRLMKDDKTLSDFGLEDNHIVHLVRGFATAAPLDRPQGRPENRPGFFPQFSPNGNRIGNGSGVFGALPEMGHMLGHIFNDPATCRRAMDAELNPEIRREVTRNTDRAMSYFESSPEDFNMLRRMYENVHEFFLNSVTSTRGNILNLSSNRLAARPEAHADRTGRGNTTNSHAPNTNPLPNPWASAGTQGSQNLSRSQRNILSNPQHTNQLQEPTPQIGTQTSQEPSRNDGGIAGVRRLDMLISLYYGHATGGGIDSSSGPQVPPEERLNTQLTQLREAGFTNTQENIRALRATAGNIRATILRLLGNPGQQS